jgi:ketosteroid isomerase-like protein
MTDRAEVDAVLDAFHAAAASADEEAYAGTLADSMVFLGTAPGERWQASEWREFVHSHFSRGKGWSYIPSSRTVDLAEDGLTAWFDETVTNEHYGACRGTGVLRRSDDGWKIEQYNLTIPVPDELAPEVVARIRELRPPGPSG